MDFDRNIVASAHGGANVMVKYGEIISAESQLCYNYAFHLAVIETFYSKHKEPGYVDETEDDDIIEFLENDEDQAKCNDLVYEVDDFYIQNWKQRNFEQHIK